MDQTIPLLILAVPLCMFLVLGLAGHKMSHKMAGILGSLGMGTALVLAYTTAFTYFFGGNWDLVQIDTEANNGRKLLVIKDSFANSFVPYLTYDYEQIIMLDLRYFSGSIDEIVANYGITQIMVTYEMTNLLTDKDMKYAYIASGGMKRIDLSNNGVHNISYNAEFTYRPAEEREYIFNHVWQQVKDKFYDPKLHNVDWEYYKKEYKKFLPHISNNVDFADMLSELLGELNGSHTGARSSFGNRYHTAVLGAFYDDSYEGNGLKIKEVLKNGPLTRANTKIKAGTIIEKINGQEIKKGEDYYPLFENLANKKVLLTLRNPDSKESYEEWVKPITQGAENGLLYKRWVERRREIVDSLSGGRIGYVHVANMNSESFREAYSDILGRYRNREAILVDTRHNGGGWLHDDLATLLSGREYQRFTPRGQYIGSDPFNKWNKPSAVLVCEDNYSNAHGFPTVYKALGIGKLIGAPVPGTMTAVWWERQINGEIVFGIPIVATASIKE